MIAMMAHASLLREAASEPAYVCSRYTKGEQQQQRLSN